MHVAERLQYLRLPIGVALFALAWLSPWLEPRFAGSFALVFLVAMIVASIARQFNQFQLRQSAPWPWPDRILNIVALVSLVVAVFLLLATDLMPELSGTVFLLMTITLLPPPLPPKIKDNP